VAPTILGEMIADRLRQRDAGVECMVGEIGGGADLVITSDIGRRLVGVPCILACDAPPSGVESLDGVFVETAFDAVIGAAADLCARMRGGRVPERRRNRRVAADLPLRVSWRGRLLYGRIVDVSTAGSRILVEGTVKVGETVAITFDVAGDSVELSGRVVAADRGPRGATEIRVAFGSDHSVDLDRMFPVAS